MKSAYELAMERLQAASSESEPALTDEQRAKIADIESRFAADKAQAELSATEKIAAAELSGDFQTAQSEGLLLQQIVSRLEEKKEAAKAEVWKQAGE